MMGAKDINEIANATDKLSEAIQGRIDKEAQLKRRLSEASGETRRTAKRLQALNTAYNNISKTMEDFENSISHLSEGQRKAAISAKKLYDANEGDLKVVNKLLDDQYNKLNRLNKRRGSYFKLEKKRRLMDYTKEVSGRVPIVGKGVEAGIGAYRGVTEAAGVLGSLGIGGGKLAGTFGVLGGVLTKLAGPLGIAVGIFKGLLEVGKAYAKLDQWVKDVNKEFIRMAGPAVGLKNVRSELKQFNSAIFDVGRNLALGIDYKDIQKMFGAMAASGLSLQGVRKRIGDYGKAIEEARKLSLEFGVGFDNMGGMMADQMINLRSSLEEVSESFSKVSYNAAQAGISSEKFYQAVSAAASSLSFYGNYLEYVSGLMDRFLKSGTMGFKDASEAATELVGLFKDPKLNRKIFALLGDQLTEVFKGQAQGFTDEIEKIRGQIDRVRKERARGGTADEIVELDNEINRLMDVEKRLISDRAAFQRAVEEGDIQSMTEALTRFKDPLKVIDMLLRSYDSKGGLDLFGQSEQALTAIEYLEKAGGVSSKIIERLRQEIETAAGASREFLKRYEMFFGGKTGIGTSGFRAMGENEALIKAIDEQITAVNTGTKSYEAVKDTIKNLMLDLEGLPEEQKNTFVNELIKASESMPDLINKVLQGDFSRYMKDVVDVTGKVVKQFDFVPMMKNLRLAAQKQALTSVRTKEVAEAAQEQRDEIVEMTTSLSKQLGIARSAARYAIGDSKLMNKISAHTFAAAKWLGDIGREYLDKKPEKVVMTPELKALARVKADIVELSKSTAVRYSKFSDVNKELLGKLIKKTKSEDIDTSVFWDKFKESFGSEMYETYRKSLEFRELIKTMKALQNAQKRETELTKDKTDAQLNAVAALTQEMKKNNKADDAMRRQFSLGTKAGEEAENLISKISGSRRFSLLSGRASKVHTGEEKLDEFLTKELKKKYKGNELENIVNDMINSEYIRKSLNNAMKESYDKRMSYNDNLGSNILGGSKVQDGEITKGGLVNAAKGDVFVDKNALAKKIRSGTGGMVDKLLRESNMKPGMIGASAGMGNNWGGIQINIEGDTSASSIMAAIPEMKKQFQEGVRQEFKRLKLADEVKV